MPTAETVGSHRRRRFTSLASLLAIAFVSSTLTACASAEEDSVASDSDLRGDRQRNCASVCGTGSVCDESIRACVPDITPPRVSFPISGDRVTGKPQIRWEAEPSGAKDAVVEICKDPACSVVVATVSGTTAASPRTALPRGAYFVRAFGRKRRANGTYLEGATPSATHVFFSSGRSVVSRGPLGIVADVDRDGLGDIGASRTDGNRSEVVVSVSGVNRTLRATGTPEQPHGNVYGAFANTMVAASDTDGDGYPEIASFDPEGSLSATTIVRFSYDVSTKRLVERQRLDLPKPAGQRLLSLAALGDIDRDGFADLAVVRTLPVRLASGPGGGTIAYQTGIEIETLYGGRGGWQRTAKTQIPFVSSEATYEGTPIPVRGVGDVDGDGVPDLAVGIQTQNTDECLPMRRGRVEIRKGTADGRFATVLTTLTDVFDVAPLGDINGDGLADVGMTREPHETRAPLAAGGSCSGSYRRTGFVPGEAIFVLGARGTSGTEVRGALPVETLPGCTNGIIGGADFPMMGKLTGGGDLDGDGFDDVAFVSTTSHPGGSQRCDNGGSVIHLVPGSAAPTFRIAGTQPTTPAGYGDFTERVRFAGDMSTGAKGSLVVVGPMVTAVYGGGAGGALALARTLSFASYGVQPLGGF